MGPYCVFCGAGAELLKYYLHELHPRALYRNQFVYEISFKSMKPVCIVFCPRPISELILKFQVLLHAAEVGR
jgi:hypothetical protein